jgi:pimeloyl-ACP methyl ester carboxylesterase
MTTATNSLITAPNQSVEDNGVRYVYRRFGNPASAAPPVLFLAYFHASLDSWDHTLIDAIAAEREVILFDNVGVSGSTGTTPRSVTEMARGALAFADALGLSKVDLFGFSLGGYVAQELTLIRPQLVRRIVLAGTAPEGGKDMHGFTDEALAGATAENPTLETALSLFFTDSEASRAKGVGFLQRLATRTEDRDERIDQAASAAQLDAITTWGIPDAGRLNRLAGIRQPTLVANGDTDKLIPTPNSYLLAEHLPNATLKIYPDAGHGFLFQYAEDFAAEVNKFLS